MTYQEFCSEYELRLSLYPFNFLGNKDGLSVYSGGYHPEIVFYLASDRFGYIDFPVLHSSYDLKFDHVYSLYSYEQVTFDPSWKPITYFPYMQTLVGKYFLSYNAINMGSNPGVYSMVIYPMPADPDFPPHVFDTFEEALDFCASATISGSMFDIKIIHLISMSDFIYEENGYYRCDQVGETFGYHGLSMITCCSPDFSRIVQILGGSPSSNELNNIKIIAFLLGCDTSENGLSGCELGLDYLKRISLLLGGSVGSDLVTTLKEICRVLGVDTIENGLSDCELSKDYVKRISTMLGA